MNKQEMIMENLIEPRVLVDLMNFEIEKILEEKKNIKIISEGIENPKFSEAEVKDIISEGFSEDLQVKMINILFSNKVFEKLTNKLLNYIIKNLDVKVKNLEFNLERKS